MVHHSNELNVYNPVEVLTMCNDYTGVSEICTLFLREPYRSGMYGAVSCRKSVLCLWRTIRNVSLKSSLPRCAAWPMKMRCHRFWQWLQSYFFSIDFPTADHMIGIGNKGFIADLMPRHPIYVSLLPKSAQDVIGQVHVNTAPALKLLENEGFIHRGYVDLFDAGPTVEAQLKQIKFGTQQVTGLKLRLVRPVEGPTLAISNPQVAAFRATISNQAQLDGDVLIITQAIADALNINAGDEVRYLNLDRGAK